MDRIDARRVSPQAVPLSAEAAERLDRLFRRYNKRMVGYLILLTGNRDLAEDIASETWLQVAHALPRITNDDRLFAYLARSARRSIGHYYRVRRNQERPLDWSDAMTSESLPAAPAAEDATDVFALAELTACEARVAKLAAQGLSQAAIGARLGRHKGTISRQLYSGARRLRSAALAG
jgi:RNA polymerase sigma-70 factor (ECF subfamily)